MRAVRKHRAPSPPITGMISLWVKSQTEKQILVDPMGHATTRSAVYSGART